MIGTDEREMTSEERENVLMKALITTICKNEIRGISTIAESLDRILEIDGQLHGDVVVELNRMGMI